MHLRCGFPRSFPDCQSDVVSLALNVINRHWVSRLCMCYLPVLDFAKPERHLHFNQVNGANKVMDYSSRGLHHIHRWFRCSSFYGPSIPRNNGPVWLEEKYHFHNGEPFLRLLFRSITDCGSFDKTLRRTRDGFHGGAAFHCVRFFGFFFTRHHRKCNICISLFSLCFRNSFI